MQTIKTNRSEMKEDQPVYFFDDWTSLDYNSLASPIQDLILILEDLFQQNPYAIAGGYVRDQYNHKTFSDVDVFIPQVGNINNFDHPDSLKIINKDFKIFKQAPHFMDLFMMDKNNFGSYKFPVQLIGWYSNIESALSGFDYEHCKFVMLPKEKKALASQEALKSIKSNKLVLTGKSLGFLHAIKKTFSFDLIIRLEILLNRTCKFISRGMLPPDNFPLEELIVSLENKFPLAPGEKERPRIYSHLLGGASTGSETLEVRNIESTPTFPFNDVMQNMCSLYLKWVVDSKDLPLYLVSESYNMRQATKIFLETKANENSSLISNMVDRVL